MFPLYLISFVSFQKSNVYFKEFNSASSILRTCQNSIIKNLSNLSTIISTQSSSKIPTNALSYFSDSAKFPLLLTSSPVLFSAVNLSNHSVIIGNFVTWSFYFCLLALVFPFPIYQCDAYFHIMFCRISYFPTVNNLYISQYSMIAATSAPLFSLTPCLIEIISQKLEKGW